MDSKISVWYASVTCHTFNKSYAGEGKHKYGAVGFYNSNDTAITTFFLHDEKMRFSLLEYLQLWGYCIAPDNPINKHGHDVRGRLCFSAIGQLQQTTIRIAHRTCQFSAFSPRNFCNALSLIFLTMLYLDYCYCYYSPIDFIWGFIRYVTEISEVYILRIFQLNANVHVCRFCVIMCLCILQVK